jgi:hypothetical protein
MSQDDGTRQPMQAPKPQPPRPEFPGERLHSPGDADMAATEKLIHEHGSVVELSRL